MKDERRKNGLCACQCKAGEGTFDIAVPPTAHHTQGAPLIHLADACRAFVQGFEQIRGGATGEFRRAEADGVDDGAHYSRLGHQSVSIHLTITLDLLAALNTGNHIFLYETPFLDLEMIFPLGGPESGSSLVSFMASHLSSTYILKLFVLHE